MFTIKGKNTDATIYTDNIDNSALTQIYDILGQESLKGSQVAIMPDVHAGSDCVIGFTSVVGDKINPTLIGVDIGCGMYTVELGKVDLDYVEIDKFIRANIPHGIQSNIGDVSIPNTILNAKLEDLAKRLNINFKDITKGMGTLGGGNHFIEIAQNDDGVKYLIIHSGSRRLGVLIEKYYRQLGFTKLTKGNQKVALKEKIEVLKNQGRQKEISAMVENYKKQEKATKVTPVTAYLEGQDTLNYLNDMQIAVEYAELNREVMAQKILDFIGISAVTSFTTTHNYIGLDRVLRKGAISAKKGERVLIPINMRDGSILATGKGNELWNNSAPHGAGRLFSRSKAKEVLNLADFEETMKGVYTTSVGLTTLDEAPEAYKPIESILNNIVDTVEINAIIKPVYNFKAL